MRRAGAMPAVPARLAALIERARLDWLAAQSEFNTVTDPELVDHAIYSIQAAERRYVYLLRLAAQMRQEEPRPDRQAAGAGPQPGGTVAGEPPRSPGATGPAPGPTA